MPVKGDRSQIFRRPAHSTTSHKFSQKIIPDGSITQTTWIPEFDNGTYSIEKVGQSLGIYFQGTLKQIISKWNLGTHKEEYMSQPMTGVWI